MERRRHWWNGRFSNATRRDLYLWFEDGRWHVEASRGSLARRSRHFAFDDEAAAMSMIGSLMGDNGEGWRETVP